MAVVVQCFHCNAVLELDDGFRGGVCRCSTCGSLLQVPRGEPESTGRRVRPAAPSAARKEEAPEAKKSGSGMNRPASADIGGSSSSFREIYKTQPVAPAAPRKSSSKSARPSFSMPSSAPPPLSPLRGTSISEGEMKRSSTFFWASVVFILLIVGVVAAAVIIYMSSAGGIPRKRRPATQESMPAVVVGEGAATKDAPTFAGIPLTGGRIIFSVDAASSMSESFDYLRRGITRTAERMPANQQMLVVLWTNDGVVKIPESGFVSGTERAELREILEKATPQGASDAEACMKKTLEIAGDDDQVIFITGKFGLPLELVEKVLSERSQDVRIDAIKLISPDMPSPLEAIAKAAGGRYIFMSGSELEQAMR